MVELECICDACGSESKIKVSEEMGEKLGRRVVHICIECRPHWIKDRDVLWRMCRGLLNE